MEVIIYFTDSKRKVIKHCEEIAEHSGFIYIDGDNDHYRFECVEVSQMLVNIKEVEE